MMKGLKSDVVRILSQNPECRDDDVLLVFAVWEGEGLRLTDEQHRHLVNLSKPGPLVRMRAHIQNVEQRFCPSGRRK